MMNIRKLISVALLATTLGFASQAAFAQFKVGVVNTDRLFSESKMAQDAQNRLKSEFSSREKEIKDLGQKLQTMAQSFQRDLPTLSDSQKEQKQKELVDLDQQFQVKRNSFQTDLAKRRSEELKRVLDKANDVVEGIAKQENFDLILQEAVYVKEQYDITDRVIKSLNGN